MARDPKLLGNLQTNILLWLKAKTGLSGGFFTLLALAVGAALTAFVFLCVSGYVWLSLKLGPVFGGLATAGFFLVLAVIGATAAALTRRRTQQRAALERASRTQGVSALIDPKVLQLAVRAGRALGWQRVIPVALLGFLATQWAQEARRQNNRDEAI
jgi:uncharacterized membrane protein